LVPNPALAPLIFSIFYIKTIEFCGVRIHNKHHYNPFNNIRVTKHLPFT
jgi:hypothetical protein